MIFTQPTSRSSHYSGNHSSLMLKSLPFFASRSFPYLRYPCVSPLFFLHSSAATLTWGYSQSARTSSSCTCILSEMDAESYTFGPYKINPNEVFYSTQLSYALVNLRPLVPDVLVCPKRGAKRFCDLNADETSDLWLVAQRVGRQLESYHKASSLTFAIQDGPQAGQTVPHVHIHILPRKGGDFEKNDEIYDAIDLKEKELKEKLDLDIERKDRSMEEMAGEASEYRKLFL